MRVLFSAIPTYGHVYSTVRLALATAGAALLGSRDERDVAFRVSQEIAAQPPSADVVSELEQLVRA